jgi:hypothetical protein
VPSSRPDRPSRHCLAPSSLAAALAALLLGACAGGTVRTSPATAGAGGAVASRLAPDTLRRLFDDGRTLDAWLDAARNRVDEWRAVDAAAREAMAADATRVARAGGLDGTWRVLVVAEDTCGDSINSVPWLARLAAAMPDAEVRIVTSAPGRAVLDAYRTHDGRGATPTILLLDADWRVVGCYLERPAPLRTWRKANPAAPADSVTARVRGFYRADGGRTVRDEFLAMVEAARAGRGGCGPERA